MHCVPVERVACALVAHMNARWSRTPPPGVMHKC